MGQRIDRVDELLRQEIGELLAREVQDPRIGFATITDVETTADLRHAKVWVSVIGDAATRRTTLAALERAMGFVRHELGVRLRIRRIPELHIHLDDSAERGTRVMQVLDALEHGDVEGGEAAADAPHQESLPTPVARVRRAGEVDPDGDAEGDDGADADGAIDASGTSGPGTRAASGPGSEVRAAPGQWRGDRNRGRGSPVERPGRGGRGPGRGNGPRRGGSGCGRGGSGPGRGGNGAGHGRSRPGR